MRPWTRTTAWKRYDREGIIMAKASFAVKVLIEI